MATEKGTQESIILYNLYTQGAAEPFWDSRRGTQAFYKEKFKQKFGA